MRLVLAIFFPPLFGRIAQGAHDEPFSFSSPPFLCFIDPAPPLTSDAVKEYVSAVKSNKIEAVKCLFDSLGFFLSSWDTSGDTIHLHPGVRSIVDSVRISSYVPCTADSVEKNFFPRPYDAGELKAFAERALRFFGNKGYPFARLSAGVSGARLRYGADSAKPDHGCVVTYTVRENGRYLFSEPIFLGKSKTNLRLIGHDIFVKKDSVFDLQKIEESKNRLLLRSYIASVENGPFKIVNTQEASGNAMDFSGAVQVPFIISENAGMGVDGAIAFQAGGAAASGLSGIFNVSLFNLFHFGESGQMTYRGEKDYQRLEFSFSMPYLFNVPLFASTGFGLEIKENDYGYLHGEIKLTTDMLRFGQWGLAIKGHEVSDSSENVSRFEGVDFIVYEEPKPYRAGKPSREIDFKIGSGIVQNNGRQLNRWHIDLAAGMHVPINYRHAVVGRIVFGTLLTDARDTLQTVELYRTGGYKSLRGYSDNEFAFRAVFYEQLEYHIYFSYSGSVYILMDGGIGFDRDAGISIKNAKKLLGYGVGIRVPVKIGDASLEWTRKYTEKTGWGRLHFSVRNAVAAGIQK